MITEIKEDSPTLERIFFNPKVIGLVANANEGKSNTLYYILDELNKKYSFKTFAYGLRNVIKGVQIVNSVPELEQIKDSIIIIDEMSSLFDLDNRKIKNQIENMIRLIFHNNNILLLAGLGENFKKFISSKLHVIIYKKVLLSDLINGSAVKNHIIAYKGHELGSTVLNLDIDEALIFDGNHYEKVKIPYLPQYDTKSNNVEILREKV
jgi:hypothetical protein